LEGYLAELLATNIDGVAVMMEKSLKPQEIGEKYSDSRQIGLKATNRIGILKVSSFTYFH